MRFLFLIVFAALAGCFQVGHAEERAISISLPSGLYLDAAWKDDWPGCTYENGVAEGRVEVVERDDTVALRVSYPSKRFGSNKSGAGWRYPFGQRESAEVCYTVRFDEDFDFVKGGKLPGLCGGPKTITGGDRVNGKEGFSARLMWRKDGRGEAYLYHMNQPEKYGDSIPFPEGFQFPRGESIRVRLQVAMNTPGERDGELRVWVATASAPKPQLLAEKTDLEWRATGDYGVDSLLFNTFFGGTGREWAPEKTQHAEFSDFRIVFPAIIEP